MRPGQPAPGTLRPNPRRFGKTDGGQVLSDGRPIAQPGRDRMMMFQESAPFPWLDVVGNVLFVLKLKPFLHLTSNARLCKRLRNRLLKRCKNKIPPKLIPPKNQI